MAGLILLLLGALALLQAGGQEAVPDRDVRRVANLLAAPHPQELRWLRTLFQSMTRVEHGPQDLVRRGWEWMAAEGTDSAQADSILYCRRQGRLSACRESLRQGAEAYPDDSRYRGNLDWLTMQPPARVASTTGSRELVQAVLAARFSRHP